MVVRDVVIVVQVLHAGNEYKHCEGWVPWRAGYPDTVLLSYYYHTRTFGEIRYSLIRRVLEKTTWR